MHIDAVFREVTDELIRNSREQQEIDQGRVFQRANLANRPLVDRIIGSLQLPGSTILGFDHLRELHERARKGESALLLCEHYSNFDIPNLFYLAERMEGGTDVTGSIVAMAGTKLNEESRFVLAFTEAYTRIVIYPARMLRAYEGTPQYEDERIKSRTINRRALHEMIRVKHSGHIVLLFPAGTRYRPGKPESKQMLVEVDSYMKGFDSVVFVGIAGNTLTVHPTGAMDKDIPKSDVMVYAASPVISCREFRNGFREGLDDPETAKRAVSEAVGRRLDEQHAIAEEHRTVVLAELATRGIEPTHHEI